MVADELATVIHVAGTRHVHLERRDGTYVLRNRVAATSAANTSRMNGRSSTVDTWDLTNAEQRAMVEELDEVRPHDGPSAALLAATK